MAKNIKLNVGKKEINEVDFSRMKKELQNEMVDEIRKYRPNYRLGDKL